MATLWGRVVAVPERNLRVVEGGETIAVAGRELDVEYTPGHASHHVVYFDRSDGTAFVGDVAGVRIPPSDFVRPPTPPPDIDVERWLESIDLVAGRRPARLALTHFGMVDDPRRTSSRWRSACASRPPSCARLLDEHGDTDAAVTAFVEEVDRRTREAAGVETAGVFEVGAPVEQLWQGLRRYWHEASRKGRGAMMATETIEVPGPAGPGTGGGAWMVIVLNDDHNTFDHVAHTLAKVIPNVTHRAGLPLRRRDPQRRARRRVVGGARAGRAVLGAAERDAGLTMAPLESG